MRAGRPLYHCGRALGLDAPKGSTGFCGPTSQCAACEAQQFADESPEPPQRAPYEACETDDLYGNTFGVALDASSGRRLGINIRLQPDEGTCLVTGVLPDGLVQDWNEARPRLAVTEGDEIVEADGVAGHASDIRKQLRSSLQRGEVLHFRVRRGRHVAAR